MSFLEKLEQAENALDKDVKSWKEERERAIKNIPLKQCENGSILIMPIKRLYVAPQERYKNIAEIAITDRDK